MEDNSITMFIDLDGHPKHIDISLGYLLKEYQEVLHEIKQITPKRESLTRFSVISFLKRMESIIKESNIPIEIKYAIDTTPMAAYITEYQIDFIYSDKEVFDRLCFELKLEGLI